MRRRRLEDRIQELCRCANERNWPRILSDLRKAIREHALKVTNRNAAAVVGGMPHIIRERRKRHEIPADWVPREFKPNAKDQSVN